MVEASVDCLDVDRDGFTTVGPFDQELSDTRHNILRLRCRVWHIVVAESVELVRSEAIVVLNRDAAVVAPSDKRPVVGVLVLAMVQNHRNVDRIARLEFDIDLHGALVPVDAV